MSFETATTWSKPRRKPSGKWVDLQPRDRTKQKRLGPSKKTFFWVFVNHVLELFFVRIAVPRVCEIQSDYCDGYHVAKAHTRRRTTIPITDWWHAFRTAWACGECHDWADQRERDDSENIIEAVIEGRFKRLGLSRAEVERILLECAHQVQIENPEKYDQFSVSFV